MANPEKPRVFVVDDERTISSTLAMILGQSGFSAEAYTSPLEALDRAKADPPDLLISDVMMPEMTGVDLAIRMQTEVPMCKILLFSGQAATADLLLQARLGGHDFKMLTKPVHPADMLRAVRSL